MILKGSNHEQRPVKPGVQEIGGGNGNPRGAKGSGGWSFPKPGDSTEAVLPEVQLYNLASDPGEKTNLQAENPEKVASLKALLTKYIKEGRSTPGAPQQNDKIEGEWKQIGFVEE